MFDSTFPVNLAKSCEIDQESVLIRRLTTSELGTAFLNGLQTEQSTHGLFIATIIFIINIVAFICFCAICYLRLDCEGFSMPGHLLQVCEFLIMVEGFRPPLWQFFDSRGKK
jgi:hypothetical protein